MISWKELEENVKTLSSFMYNSNAVNETINGVKFDCVLKPKEDHWIVIEVSENETLEKVRTDIAKFSTCRQYLFSKEIYSEFFLILRDRPTETMQTTGKGCKINVLSYESFSKQFIDYESYVFIRSQKVFGSAINPFSGEPDKIDYTPVLYENIKTKKNVSLKEIAQCVFEGKRMVLLGNYGTGKSRCIRELFFYLSNKATNRILYPIAINLKEHWGTQRADEIIRRHFGLLGLSHMADSLIKIIDKDKFIFLLDGFDEIGAQVWSNDTFKLQQIRASSLAAVKDLITTTKSPIVISGREHYFNSDKEMFKVLGLDYSETEFLRCKEEFTEEEMRSYLKSISLVIDLPIWLPRRPLICQIINTIQKEEIDKIFINSYSSVEFWNTLIKNICERESKISPLLQSETIFNILKEVANITRTKQENIGPITIGEINKSFEKVVGTAPVDDSAVMLQRLPGLGRISSENMDRQFIDFYILDGLRAENLIDIIYQSDSDVIEETWLNPIGKIGIEIIAKKIQIDKSANIFIEFLKKSIQGNNNVLTGDILASLIFYAKKSSLDLGGLIIEKTIITSINFSKSLIENFLIKDSQINEIDVSNFSFSKITLKDCNIKKIYGISSEAEIPSFLIKPKIGSYHSKPMEADNKLFELKSTHMIFIAIIKKTFFLGGQNKSEHELIESFGNKDDRKIALNIIKILVKEKILSKPDSENKYTPKTFNRNRMKEILNDLNKSVKLQYN